jgi:hypothetical protein
MRTLRSWPTLCGLACTALLAGGVALAQSPAKPAEANPKVEPGKVRWHPDVDTACKASQKTGKPVFIFYMMGKLDDQFC